MSAAVKGGAAVGPAALVPRTVGTGFGTSVKIPGSVGLVKTVALGIAL